MELEKEGLPLDLPFKVWLPQTCLNVFGKILNDYCISSNLYILR